MLTDKSWKPDLLFRLFSGFLLLFGLMGAVSGILLTKEAAATTEGRFGGMVFFTVMMHGGGLLLVSLFLRAHELTWSQAFGFRDFPVLTAVAFGIATGLAFLPAAWTLGQLSTLVIEMFGRKAEVQAPVELLQQTEMPLQRLYFGFMAVVMAPVVEEIFFRGLLYTGIKQTGHRRAAGWISSILFAMVHANLMSFVPLMILAMLLVWLYETTGNLLSCIAAHSFFNAVNFLLLINQKAIEEWLKQQAVIW